MRGLMKENIKFFKKITVRIPLLIVLILTIGIGIVIFYYLNSQNAAIISSREQAVLEESEIVHAAIKNNMLAGEAPIAVELFDDFAKSEFLSDVRLYRIDGQAAFSDERTINLVNRIIGEKRFSLTNRSSGIPPVSDKDFQIAVNSVDDRVTKLILPEEKKIIIYKPLINQPKCSNCHGIDHVLRGVIKISTPIDDVYKQTNINTIQSAGIYGSVVLVLTITIFFILNRVVIRTRKITGVVNLVGEGDLSEKIEDNYEDELGLLALKINNMIDGLREKLKLSKFVSKSTLDHVKTSEDITLGGEKKYVTVLFSDIRGFTSFSEDRDPEEVMQVLNQIMHIQSEIISNLGGDIDKFVGDEIMAVFEGKDMAIRAAKSAEQIRDTLKNMKDENPDTVAAGIGINTGYVISGNMGGAERIDRTIIGDTVNLGARLCSKAGGNVIVLSEFTAKELENTAQVKEHNPIKVKGKKKPVRIFTLRRTLP